MVYVDALKIMIRLGTFNWSNKSLAIMVRLWEKVE